MKNSVVCADLHIHSTYSDGLFTPLELIDICKEVQLEIIAITDHDTVSCTEELREAARDKIDFIPAVEMSSNIGELDVHILGYYVDCKNEELLTYFEIFKQHRYARAKKIIEKLSRDGIKLDFDQIKTKHKNSALGRPHIAEALLQNGYVGSINEAFNRFLGYHSPYYVPKKNIHPKEVIQKIRKWKGIPVIAHPAIINDDGLIDQLISDGPLGIEVWHPDHNQWWRDKLHRMALKNGLLMTGGSDFHGFHGKYSQIGKCGCERKHVSVLKQRAGRPIC